MLRVHVHVPFSEKIIFAFLNLCLLHSFIFVILKNIYFITFNIDQNSQLIITLLYHKNSVIPSMHHLGQFLKCFIRKHRSIILNKY